MKRAEYVRVSISSGQTKSDIVNIANLRVWGIEFPSAFDGLSVSFETAEADAISSSKPTDADMTSVVDPSGTALSQSVQAGKVVALDPSSALSNFLQHAGWVRIVAASAQTADRTITLHGTLDAS